MSACHRVSSVLNIEYIVDDNHPCFDHSYKYDSDSTTLQRMRLYQRGGANISIKTRNRLLRSALRTTIN